MQIHSYTRNGSAVSHYNKYLYHYWTYSKHRGQHGKNVLLPMIDRCQSTQPQTSQSAHAAHHNIKTTRWYLLMIFILIHRVMFVKIRVLTHKRNTQTQHSLTCCYPERLHRKMCKKQLLSRFILCRAIFTVLYLLIGTSRCSIRQHWPPSCPEPIHKLDGVSVDWQWTRQRPHLQIWWTSSCQCSR